MTWGLHSDIRLAILYNVRCRAEVTLTSLLMQSLWDKINLHTSPYWSNSSLALPSLNWLAHVWKEIDGFLTLRRLSGHTHGRGSGCFRCFIWVAHYVDSSQGIRVITLLYELFTTKYQGFASFDVLPVLNLL